MLMRLNKFSEKASKNIKNSEDKLMNKKVVVISENAKLKEAYDLGAGV